MNNALKLLVVEDSENDVLLLIRVLRLEGYIPDYLRVETADELREALANDHWDIVITDHKMPNLDSNDVITIVKQTGLDLPVIIVSGLIPESTAIAAMKSGAHDYIMKENLARLIPAIERELDDTRVRQARKKAESTIHHMAYHDALTNLYNRTGFEIRLQQSLDTHRNEGQTHAVLYIDLDQFKVINDTCGHIAGDALLRQMATIFKQQIRESDVLARLGGDEFGIFLENCRFEYAMDIAKNILESLIEFRFVWQNNNYKVSASIGFVEIDDDYEHIDEVLSQADVACYMAKELGRNRIKVYKAHDYELTKHFGEMRWVNRINQALEEDQFRLYKQAIIPANAKGNGLQRWEFLLRLVDLDGSILSPNEFIPAAERYNLMPSIDRWVVKAAFSYLSQVLANHELNHSFDNEKSPGPGMYFINISGTSISEEGFFNFINEELRKHKIPPQMICFEISETAAVTHLSESIKFITKIRKGGCKIALDDFGSGLSSFYYLKTIPADYIKIDGSFVGHMINEPIDQAIVEAINQIGHIAGLQTIAELVENDTTVKKLRQIGVDFFQGYALETPHPIENIALSVH